jgi:phosphoribosyl-ATP pyrophosphohydrolase
MTHILDRLAATIDARKGADPEQSYSASLLGDGGAKACAKVAEESDEFIRAVTNETEPRVVSEAADLIYHVLVALAARDVPAAAVWAELEKREGTSGHDEKASRKT